MRIVYSVVILFLFSINYSVAQTSFPNGIGGCIAHWDFDIKGEGTFLTNLPDVSLNGNDGIPFDILSVSGFKGMYGTAGQFNGSTSYALVNDAPILKTDSITVIAIINFSDFYSGNCQFNTIIYKGFDHNSDQNWSFFVGDHNYDKNCNTLHTDKQLLNFKTTYSSSSYYPHYSTTDYILANKWYFLASVYNGSTAKIYIIEFDTASPPNFANINPVTTLQLGGINSNNPYEIYIGRTQNPPFPYWVNGTYDELLLYNRPLSNSEIIDVAKHFYGDVDTTNNNDTPNSINRLHYDPINVYVHNKTVRISDPDNIFSKIELFDLQGRRVAVSIEKEIVLTHLPSQILFARCYSKNGQIYYKKIVMD